MKIKEDFKLQIDANKVPVRGRIKIKFYSITVPDEIEIEEQQFGFGESRIHRTNPSEALWCMMHVVGEKK